MFLRFVQEQKPCPTHAHVQHFDNWILPTINSVSHRNVPPFHGIPNDYNEILNWHQGLLSQQEKKQLKRNTVMLANTQDGKYSNNTLIVMQHFTWLNHLSSAPYQSEKKIYQQSHTSPSIALLQIQTSIPYAICMCVNRSALGKPFANAFMHLKCSHIANTHTSTRTHM